MSTAERKSEYFERQRECLYCHAGIAVGRPVFLVGMSDGQIIGPFHAGCAERLKLAVAKTPRGHREVYGQRFGSWPSIREETLPE